MIAFPASHDREDEHSRRQERLRDHLRRVLNGEEKLDLSEITQFEYDGYKGARAAEKYMDDLERRGADRRSPDLLANVASIRQWIRWIFRL